MISLASLASLNLAYAVGFIILGSVLVGPARQAYHLVSNPMRREEVRTGRIALVTAIALVSIALATGSISQLLYWLDRHGTACSHARTS